jgi:hypothetical protein
VFVDFCEEFGNIKPTQLLYRYRDEVEVMVVFEFKAFGKKQQFDAVDEAIRTVQFIRNKALRFWMENTKVDKYGLNKYSAVLATG